ncbi:MAG: NAD-glutamate dehydrogenase [Deltaproteobacteria bacterium]|nr:NAD-glutamate dehydrogenase [Deltaproteobacteria bacterium]
MTDISEVAQHLNQRLREKLERRCQQEQVNLKWLQANMNPYFFLTMAGHGGALDLLVAGLDALGENRHILLAERDELLIVAGLSQAGSIYKTLASLSEKPTYAEITHSYSALPGGEAVLEVQRYEFKKVSSREVRAARKVRLSRGLLTEVEAALRRLYPEFDFSALRALLTLLAVNNPDYLKVSPAERIARLLWLYQQGRRYDGLYFAAEEGIDACDHAETRILFSVGNPPGHGFLEQVLEVFHRLKGRVSRAYCLEIATGVNPHFLGTFYLEKESWMDADFYRRLKRELYNTQILANSGSLYRQYVLENLADGEDLLLINAMVAFSHTNLAHSQPDLYDLSEVRRAFHASPEIALALVRFFRARFTPEAAAREAESRRWLAAVEELIAGYNTGHRHFDDLRRTIFATALLLLRHTLKCNFFVPEKHALAFRLDPAYLKEMRAEFTADLPSAPAPFRITFFYGRYGAGYHVGFSDIARGGWRTISCSTTDDFLATADTLLREVYVLAHTQHLKNKDIYEGGSKMVVVHDVSDLSDSAARLQSLYKVQYGFINAFFDIFVTDGNGRAKNPLVVDYYAEAEPIELGPDENMHDAMIELIARQSQKRGYILGGAVISSKAVGINHKQYGVTSLGVITFAEITMAELGINMRRDPFTVKFTGGPNGDVAGNAMRLLLERSPQVSIVLIVAGSGVLFDPQGLDHEELRRIILKENIDAFAPEKLNPGGFLLFSRERRREGLVELYRRMAMGVAGVCEEWVTADAFHREFDHAVFTVPADLFIPAGGRPETVDSENWAGFFSLDGTPTCKAIVEGANSFITPAAREKLQEKGVVVIRDAAANKCGVISSSYEIIANLVLSEREFIKHKDEYVRDVLAILEKRAADEARLIFRRRRLNGELSYTAIAGALSNEINHNYSRLFNYFQEHAELLATAPIRLVLKSHLPQFLRQSRYLSRLPQCLPLKYRAAMVAAELAARMVYDDDWGSDFGVELANYVKRKFK